MQQGHYLTLDYADNGDLLITLTDEGREELEHLAAQGNADWQIFYLLFQDFLANGWSSIEADEIGALTGCELIISPDAEYDDEGILKDVQTIFWHERYAVEDAAEELRNGSLRLRKATE